MTNPQCQECEDQSTAFVLVQSLGLTEHLCELHKGARVAGLEAALISHTVVSTFQQPPTDAETIELLRSMLQRSAPELRALLQKTERVAMDQSRHLEHLRIERARLEEALTITTDRNAEYSALIDQQKDQIAALGVELEGAAEAVHSLRAELDNMSAELDEEKLETEPPTAAT